MCQLNLLRSNEITEARIKECEKNKTAGLVVCFGSLCALVVTVGAAAPIPGAAAVGSGALSLGSKVTGDTLRKVMSKGKDGGYSLSEAPRTVPALDTALRWVISA